MTDLKIGDVVVLKSGSPKMTVNYIETRRDNQSTMIFCN